MALSDIRVNIDRVDSQIRELFIERMGLAEQVAQEKAKTEDKIFKPEREQIIIENNSRNVDPHLVMEYKALIKRIMEVSRKYQYGRTLELRDCFPYAYETSDQAPEHLCMKESELYLCDFTSRDQVRTEKDYEQIVGLLESGEADAGAGILEQIGHGVSDELNSMLMEHGLYINRCHVQEKHGERYKLVEFSKVLRVLPEHNRLKIVFECPNRSGSVSAILSMISDYGVNLTEIHSIPFTTGQEWNYRFFVELGANMDQKEIRALVFQLSQETEKMQILGSYFCEGDL